MPASRSDRQLLVITGVFVAVAGVMVAGVLWFATSRDAASGPAGPLNVGPRSTLVTQIREHDGPLYLASPFEDVDGFWLDLEDGNLVALVLDTPGPGHCTAKWKQSRNAYIDCHDNALFSVQLDRYAIRFGAKDSERAGSVIVDLRNRQPAPAPAGNG